MSTRGGGTVIGGYDAACGPGYRAAPGAARARGGGGGRDAERAADLVAEQRRRAGRGEDEEGGDERPLDEPLLHHGRHSGGPRAAAQPAACHLAPRGGYHSRMHQLALLAAILAASPTLASAQPKPKIAVLDFTANGASKELASAAGGIAANELDRMGAFQIVTSDAIRNMLAFEKQRQMLGCAEAGCMAEIGGALGVDWLVSGKVTKLAAAGGVPETFTLDLTLTNVRKAQREGSVIETARTEAELVTQSGKGAQKLVAKILAGRTGRLVVSAVEAGAVVKVDDQVKGTTPLRGAVVLPAGPHALSIEKQGFVAFQKDVQVEAGKVVEEQRHARAEPGLRARVRVAPEEAPARRLALDRRRGGRASPRRSGSRSSANSLYGNETTAGTFLYDRAKLQDGVELQGGVDLRAEANKLKSDIETRQTMSYARGRRRRPRRDRGDVLLDRGRRPEPLRRVRGHVGAARPRAAPRRRARLGHGGLLGS